MVVIVGCDGSNNSGDGTGPRLSLVSVVLVFLHVVETYVVPISLYYCTMVILDRGDDSGCDGCVVGGNDTIFVC